MTTPDAAETPVPDFTIRRPPIQFTIDGDTFSAPNVLSPITLRKLAAQASSIGDLGNISDIESIVKAIDVLGEIMVALMPGASGQLFKRRLGSEGGDDEPAPIDLMGQAIPAFYFLLERYGLRPTVPSSPSPTGSTDGQTNTPSDGISSTAGASPTDSGPAVVDSTSPTGLI